MKNLYDIYENDIASTPANTVGIGNPMLPTAEEPGTEPLCTAKCKKEKKKKSVKEGILDDMDSVLDSGGVLVEFSNWFVEGFSNEYKLKPQDKEDCLNALLHGLTLKNKNTVVINEDKIDEYLDSTKSNIMFDGYAMYITTPIPSSVKKIEVHYANCFDIYSYIEDLSNIDISVYKDSGKSLGDIKASFKKVKDVKFGKLECCDLGISGLNLTTITFNKNSVLLGIDTTRCANLIEIYNGNTVFSNVLNSSFNMNYIKYQLHKANIIPWGSSLTIKSVANKTLTLK